MRHPSCEHSRTDPSKGSPPWMWDNHVVGSKRIHCFGGAELDAAASLCEGKTSSHPDEKSVYLSPIEGQGPVGSYTG